VTDAPAGPPRWTFVLPGLPRTAGGLIAAYELANALAGPDRVRVAHLPTPEAQLRSTSEIPWFTFRPEVEHTFLRTLDPHELPDADLVVHTVMAIDLCLAAGAHGSAGALLAHLQGDGEGRAALPILFVQALGVFSEATELRALAGAGPKVCVASWIARNLVGGGLPPPEVVPIVNGVDHRIFRVTAPVASRAPSVAMNHNPHPLKNMDGGIDALERVDRELAVPSVLFGARPPARPLRGRMRFVLSPRQTEVAERILARSSVYLQPSTQEGFGLSALEAMACGCALVTTSNGGSEDYAIDDETAVVCAAEPGAMADAIGSLLGDDARRIRIATNGADQAKQFRWSTGAERLRALGAAYLADPGAFRHGAGTRLDPSVLRLHA